MTFNNDKTESIADKETHPLEQKEFKDLTIQSTHSEEDIFNVKQSAEENGLMGELFINKYLCNLKSQGKIREIEWVSEMNKFSAYDFCLTDLNNERVLLDVKSTNGEFDQRMFISYNEMQQMAYGNERYDIYRVYKIQGDTANLRILRNIRGFAKEILDVLGQLPKGVNPQNISVLPSLLSFDSEINLTNK